MRSYSGRIDQTANKKKQDWPRGHLLSLLIGRDERETKLQGGRIHHKDMNLLLNKGSFLWGDLSVRIHVPEITQIVQAISRLSRV